MVLSDTFTDLFYFTEVNCVYDFDQFTYDSLRKKYDEMIDVSEKSALLHGSTTDTWRKAFFAVAVWIDETVQLSSWQYKLSWTKDSLQRTYYKTSNGGVEFYTALERLEPNENSIREIYDLCLSLGFKGTYYRDADRDTRSQIVSKTIQFLKTDHTTDIPGILFPCAFKGNAKLNIHADRQNRLFFIISAFALPAVISIILYISFQTHLSALYKSWTALTGGSLQ
jgi:type VI secretion system protein ImpK